jgi:hypothetical protein
VALSGQLTGLELTAQGSLATAQLTLEAQSPGEDIRLHLANPDADSQWYLKANTQATAAASKFAIGFYENAVDSDLLTITGDGKVSAVGSLYGRAILSGANGAGGLPIAISINTSSAATSLTATNATAANVGLRVTSGNADLLTGPTGAAGLSGGSLQATNVANSTALYDASNAVDVPIYVVTTSASVDPGGNLDQTAKCKAGDIVLSGGCETPDSALGGLIGRMFITAPDTFTCNFTGNPAAPEIYATYAVCLKAK